MGGVMLYTPIHIISKGWSQNLNLAHLAPGPALLTTLQCHIHGGSQGLTWILYDGNNEMLACIKEGLLNMNSDNVHISKITIPTLRNSSLLPVSKRI